MEHGAAVIDLEAFRRQREERSARRLDRGGHHGRAAWTGAAPVCVMPFVVAWIPVWPVV
jgi:hypothetical protein